MALLHFSFIKIASYTFALTRCSWFWNRSADFTHQRRWHWFQATFLWIQQEKCIFSTIFMPAAQDIFLKLLTLRFSRTYKRFYSSNWFRVKNIGGIYSASVRPQLRNGKGDARRTACLQFLPSATSLFHENVLKIASNDMALLYFSFIKIVKYLPWRDVVGFEIGRRILPISDDCIQATFLRAQDIFF